MAIKRPLVNYSGVLEELRLTDSLPSSGGGGITISTAQLNVGTLPIQSKTVVIADASATLTSTIFVSVDGSGLNGANTASDLEWSPISISALCQLAGQITFILSGNLGFITGKFNVNYFII